MGRVRPIKVAIFLTATITMFVAAVAVWKAPHLEFYFTSRDATVPAAVVQSLPTAAIPDDWAHASFGGQELRLPRALLNRVRSRVDDRSIILGDGKFMAIWFLPEPQREPSTMADSSHASPWLVVRRGW